MPTLEDFMGKWKEIKSPEKDRREEYETMQKTYLKAIGLYSTVDRKAAMTATIPIKFTRVAESERETLGEYKFKVGTGGKMTTIFEKYMKFCDDPDQTPQLVSPDDIAKEDINETLGSLNAVTRFVDGRITGDSFVIIGGKKMLNACHGDRMKNSIEIIDMGESKISKSKGTEKYIGRKLKMSTTYYGSPENPVMIGYKEKKERRKDFERWNKLSEAEKAKLENALKGNMIDGDKPWDERSGVTMHKFYEWAEPASFKDKE